MITYSQPIHNSDGVCDFGELLLNRVTRGLFLNRVQVENFQVANLIRINLFTSNLELEKFST
jgi:hypothetical protein